jgi:hypothetical protein
LEIDVAFELKIPVLGTLAIRTVNQAFGGALSWLVVVLVALGAGYGVDRLSTSLGMRPVVTLALVLITAGVVLVAGCLFVWHLNTRRPIEIVTKVDDKPDLVE